MHLDGEFHLITRLCYVLTRTQVIFCSVDVALAVGIINQNRLRRAPNIDRVV